MSRPWAYAFYHSRAWRQCRESYAISVHWLCERCGDPGEIVHHNKVWLTPANINDTNITLGHWNLQMVCTKCHNRIHFERIEATRDGFAFDEEGNLVQRPSPHTET